MLSKTRLSEHSLAVMFNRTSLCQAFFTKTIFHIPSGWLIWRAAPSIFLAHGLPHGSRQLFLFSLLVVASQKCFYSCDGKHTLISFSHWVKKKTEGDTLRVAKPTKGKCAQYKAAFVSRWRLKSWILRRHESVGMFSVHKRWRQATDFSSLTLIPKQTVKCTLWFPSQSTV